MDKRSALDIEELYLNLIRVFRFEHLCQITNTAISKLSLERMSGCNDCIFVADFNKKKKKVVAD